MIVDDLRAASAGFRALTQGAQVVRVPFPVCPFTDQPDGEWGLWWRGWPPDRASLIPSRDGLLDASWWRPPFERMVIVSEQSERGALIVMPGMFNLRETRLDDGLSPEWGATLALVVKHKHPSTGADIALPLTAVRVASAAGRVATESDEGALAVCSMLARELTELYRLDAASILEQLWRRHPDSRLMDVRHMVMEFATTCALMTCKNIATEVERPPERLQRRRQKRGDLPLVSYHVLKVRRGQRRCAHAGASESEPLALHWVRGHFKHYTKERPLLGRAVGTYWWSPHLAGQADRVALKDYLVEP